MLKISNEYLENIKNYKKARNVFIYFVLKQYPELFSSIILTNDLYHVGSYYSSGRDSYYLNNGGAVRRLIEQEKLFIDKIMI